MKLLNEIYSAILSATAEKVYAVKQKENEKVTYQPPVITDGVLVQMGRTTITQKRATAKCNGGIKWYEDKLITPELKIV